MPRVSVLMPVYNGARFIGEAVGSVLAQTFTDFELIVIDDASTDGTAAILRAITDPRVIVVHNDANVGPARTQNRALVLARGEYIAQHDADDVSDTSRLARQVAFLDEHPDIALVGSWYRKLGEDGAALGERSLPTESAQIAWTLLFYCPLVHSAVLYRKAAVIDVGGYNEAFAYASDYELWSRVARTHRLANVPAVLVAYRLTAGSLTATIGRSSDEGGRVAYANVTALVEGVGRRPPPLDAHRAMIDLVSGAHASRRSDVIEAAFGGILDLLDAFCLHRELTTTQVADVRASVRATLRGRLVECMGALDDRTFARLRALVADDDAWLAMCSSGSARRAFIALRTSPLGTALARWVGSDR